MSHRRWVYTDQGIPLAEPYEVDTDWRNAELRAPVPTEQVIYSNLRATDGTPIDSRTKHRNYMKANGLTLISDFSDEYRAKQKASRAREDRTVLRETIGRAVYQHQRGTKL